MKQSKLLLLLCILLAGFKMHALAQDQLPPVTVVSLNYKYIRSINDTNAAQPVRLLQHRAASYDLKNSEFYEDEYDDFFISFYLPEGQILGTYDKDGKLLRTAEKFKNIALPVPVRKTLAERYPGWTTAKDVYLVNYDADATNQYKRYKVVLENGKKRLRLKLDDKGTLFE